MGNCELRVTCYVLRVACCGLRGMVCLYVAACSASSILAPSAFRLFSMSYELLSPHPVTRKPERAMGYELPSFCLPASKLPSFPAALSFCLYPLTYQLWSMSYEHLSPHPVTRNPERAMSFYPHNRQHTTYNMQHAIYNLQLTTYNLQHTSIILAHLKWHVFYTG